MWGTGLVAVALPSSPWGEGSAWLRTVAPAGAVKAKRLLPRCPYETLVNPADSVAVVSPLAKTRTRSGTKVLASIATCTEPTVV